MLPIVSCIVFEHDLRYVAFAALVCVLGSVLTMRLFSRSRHTAGLQKLNWLFLAGVIGGTTVWATHFVAMLGYIPGAGADFDPDYTLASIAIAIATTMAGLAIASYGGRSLLVEGGGVIVGLGVAAMHYTGMAAYVVQGIIVWDRSFIVASLILAAMFGALATNRVVRPLTRWCRHGSGSALILCIIATHFTSIDGMQVVLDPRLDIPAEFLSPLVMSTGVVTLTLILLALVGSAYLLDFQSSQQAVERYRHLSLHDALTGLPNRSAFTEYLGTLIARPIDNTARVAILSFDLDRFKEVNDVHGHAAGDAVLRTVAERINGIIRPGEFIARTGGDEFVALTSLYYTRADAFSFAKRILAEIAKPIQWTGHTLSIGSSVGISICADGSKATDEVLAQADVAMYRAKASGTNKVCFYDSSMDQAARERNALAMDMRAALENNQFELFYQQQNETTAGTVIGFEALLRWRHPTRGMVSPVEFIPIAERTGFILELGEWVLRTACLEAASWVNPLTIAVNVAPAQLADATFPETVQRILRETGLSATRLELEITESGIIADQRNALAIIRQLKSFGVKIAMDDYGTGYSSLATLQSFPFDKLKIDRSFINGLATNAQSAAIVRSTLILAESLSIPVLAEGVETEDHVTFLRGEGCVQVQGYLYGRPVPQTDIAHIVGRIPQAAVSEPEEEADADPEIRLLAAG